MKLNEKQLAVIAEVLNLFDRKEVNTTGVQRISGGFAIADMFDYDKDFIDIQLKWGVQSDCENTVHTENYKLAMKIIDDDSIANVDKVAHIEEA